MPAVPLSVPPEVPEGGADDLRGGRPYRLPPGGFVAEHEMLRGHRQRGVQVRWRALDEQVGLILREGEQSGAGTLLPGAHHRGKCHRAWCWEGAVPVTRVPAEQRQDIGGAVRRDQGDAGGRQAVYPLFEEYSSICEQPTQAVPGCRG